MAPKKRMLKIMKIEEIQSSCGDEVHESCLLIDDNYLQGYNYESFPEDPHENSINELVLYFKDNKELFDHFKDGKKDEGLPEWLYISEFFKRHNCFGSKCVQKAVENMQQLENFFFTGIRVPSLTPSSAVMPWTKASLEPVVQPAVIGEVLLLLANLHYDCVRTHDKLRQEIDIIKYITSQIDEMSEKKLRIMAAAVQKEHNTSQQKNLPCFMKSQYMRRLYGSCQKKMNVVTNYNRLLNEDIEYSTAQIPLVEEKMKIEQINIDNISAAVDEGNLALDDTIKRLNITKANYMEAKRLTEEEKKSIRNKISEMYEEIENLKKTANIYDKNYKQMQKDIILTKQKIRENEEAKTVFEVKIENYKSSLQMLNMEYKDLTQRLSGQLKTNNSLRKETNKLQRTLERKSTDFTDNIGKLESENENLQQQLRRLETSNIEMTTQAKIMDEEIETFHTHKNQNEKSLNRISYEIIKMQNQILLAKHELNRYLDLNSHFKSSINQQEKNNFEKERKLEELLEETKVKMAEATKIYDMLRDEVDKAHVELEEMRKAHEEEKEMLLKHDQETIDALTMLDEKLRRLNYLKSQREKVVDSLKQKKEKLADRFQERLRDDSIYLERLTPYKEMLSENMNYLEQKEEEIKEMESTMKTQIRSMEQQRHTFNSVTNKLKVNIRRNRSTMMNITRQLKKIEVASEDSLDRLEETQDRISQLYTQHKELLGQRQEVLKDVIEQKQMHLKENSELASRYRWHQNHLLYLQYCFAQKSDKNLHLEQALNDLRQLLSMQLKVHQNLHTYFQYRGMYNTQELQQLQHKSNMNQKKAHDLKRSIDNNIESMSSFIDREIAESIQRSVRIKEKRQLLPKIKRQ